VQKRRKDWCSLYPMKKSCECQTKVLLSDSSSHPIFVPLNLTLGELNELNPRLLFLRNPLSLLPQKNVRNPNSNLPTFAYFRSDFNLLSTISR